MDVYKVSFRIQGYHRYTHVVAVDEEDARVYINERDNCEVTEVEEADLESVVSITDRAAAKYLGGD